MTCMAAAVHAEICEGVLSWSTISRGGGGGLRVLLLLCGVVLLLLHTTL